MPSSSDEMRAKWGGDGGVGEDKAEAFLEGRGFVLHKDWHWTHPENRVPTEEELEAARFLVEEWDYAGIEFTSPCNHANLHVTPVHQHEDGSWWFYEETWHTEGGPYDNAENAKKACENYAKQLQAYAYIPSHQGAIPGGFSFGMSNGALPRLLREESIMMSYTDRVAKTAIHNTDEAHAALLVSDRWPYGDLVPAIVMCIVTNLWRNSWGEVVHEDGNMDAHVFVGGGQEFVNERFNTLIMKCVPALRAFRPEQRDGSRPIPAVGLGQPIVDNDGHLVIAVRATDRDGNPSPQPKTHPAWVLTHAGNSYWAPKAWLRRYGLLTELSWWGDEEQVDEEGNYVWRKRHKRVSEVVYHPSLFTQAELDELRAIIVSSQVAEEEGVIKRKALTMRTDG